MLNKCKVKWSSYVPRYFPITSSSHSSQIVLVHTEDFIALYKSMRLLPLILSLISMPPLKSHCFHNESHSRGYMHERNEQWNGEE